MNEPNHEENVAETEPDQGVSSASSRRGFLGCVTAAGAATALDQSGARLADQVTEQQLTAEYFSKHIGERFQVGGEGFEAYSMRLASVDSHPRGDRPAELRDPFSILFRAPNSIQIRQDVRTLRNSRFGSVQALVVPVGMDGDERLYEVVFS